jgi:hypothetical protein
LDQKAALQWSLTTALIVLKTLGIAAEVEPSFLGTHIIRMKDNEHTRIRLSRGYAADLRNLSGWKE